MPETKQPAPTKEEQFTNYENMLKQDPEIKALLEQYNTFTSQLQTAKEHNRPLKERTLYLQSLIEELEKEDNVFMASQYKLLVAHLTTLNDDLLVQAATWKKTLKDIWKYCSDQARELIGGNGGAITHQLTFQWTEDFLKKEPKPKAKKKTTKEKAAKTTPKKKEKKTETKAAKTVKEEKPAEVNTAEVMDLFDDLF